MARSLEELQALLKEADELLHAIRTGEVDALVVSGPHGDQVYTLRGAEHPYRVMVEAMSEGAVILTADGTIFYANRSFAEMLDVPLEELIGSKMGRLVLAADLPRFDAITRQIDLGINKGEIRLSAKGGSVVPVQLSISSFHTGTPGSACAVVTDLTEHKRHQALISAEAVERTKLAEAEAGQQRIASILESITDAFLAVDREWRITDANQRAAAKYGMTRDALVGTVLWDVSPQGRVPELDEQYRRAMTERIPIHSETPSAAAQGRWFERHIYPTDEGLAVFFRDITERKRIAERTAYQARLLASVHDAILATDDQLVLTAWNSAAEEIYGWKAEKVLGRRLGEVLGRRSGDVIRSDFTDTQWAGTLACLNETGHCYVEVAQYTRDNRRIWMEGHISVLRDEAGRITGYVAANRDITERKRAEDELRRSEANLADAQALNHTGSWTWNVSTGELFWSLEHFRIFGLDPGTFRPTKESTQRLIHPHDLPVVSQTLDRAVRERCNFDVNYRIMRPDGSIRYHHGLGHPVVNELGDLEFVGSVVDVSERKQAEEHLRRSESYLVEGQRISHTGTWAWNVSTGELFWSLEHFRICGVDPETFKPTIENAFQLIHPEDRISVSHDFQRAIDEGGDFDRELRIVRPDGSVRHVHSLAHPVFNDSGDVTEHVGTIVDLTERREADEERARLLRQVVQAQEDERRRIALEMHDQFGQQLSALVLKLSALRRERGRRMVLGEQLASLEAITRQLDTDLELIVSRLRPPALDDLGLVAALTNYVTRWSQHFDIHAEVHASGMQPDRLTNEIDTALYRVAQEALNNIAKHARARNVAVLLDARPERVSLIVEDDGVGLDPEQPAGSRQRFGVIGMRERATLLGGTLDIESHSGKGTSVVARIPVPSSPERKPV